MDAQDIGNRHGASIRAVEAALSSGNISAAQAAIAQVHQTAGEIYNFAVSQGVELNWDELAGNASSGVKGGMHTNAGAKSPPPASE